MSKSVWVVESGDYSDRRIRAIFDDEVLCEAYIEAFTTTTYMGELFYTEWELNDVPEGWLPGLKPYTVDMRENGEITNLEQEEIDAPSASFYRNHETPMPDDYLLTLNFYARDEEHARKIAGEKWAKIKYSSEWGKENK